MKRNYIGGRWVDGGVVTGNINPSDTRDEIDCYAQAEAGQADDAVSAAAGATGAWGASTPQRRADALDGIGAELLARRDELGNLLSREEGKTLREGIGEVVRAGNIFKFFAQEALRPHGKTVPSVRSGIDVEMTREPVGAVAIITPWNFPMAIPAWKIAPALAFGNTVVFKPAELVPGSAHALAEIISRANLPAGAFNLVMGRGAVVGNALLRHRCIDAVSFTGSVATGQRIASACVTDLKKFQLEMGGKNPLVVLDDADLSVAVECAIQGAFFSTGQRCTASSRLIVTAGIYNSFMDALTERTRALTVDDALAPGTEIGPVVDVNQLEQNLRYVEIGRAEGATLVCGGERLEREKPGFYMAPALFADATPSMRIAREEIFGPVAAVIRVADYDEALAVANDTEFGLCGGICTTSLKHAHHFKRHAQVGMAMVNISTAGVDYHVPFGGRKGSSFGPREQGQYAADFYTTVKTAYVAAG